MSHKHIAQYGIRLLNILLHVQYICNSRLKCSDSDTFWYKTLLSCRFLVCHIVWPSRGTAALAHYTLTNSMTTELITAL